MSVLKLLAQRIALGIFSLFTVAIIVFLAVGLLPGDTAEAMLGQSATPETVHALRVQLGLDQPPMQRFFNWFSQLLQGDLGVSLANQRPISELISTRLGSSRLCANRFSARCTDCVIS